MNASAPNASAPQREGGVASSQEPDSQGKFSLSEDWIATITGLVILGLCLVGIIPDLGEWL